MARIFVRLQDGQEGSIDDSEFNPATMTKIGGGSTPTTPTTTPTAPVAPPDKSILQGNIKSDKLFSGDSLLSNVLNSVSSPFVKTGKNLAGAGFEVARAADSALGNKNAYVNQDTRQTVENPFIDVNNFTNGLASKGVTDQVKNSAAIASWGVPFGKAGFLGSKFIAPGAAVGAAQALPDATSAEDVVKGAVTGAVTGGALQLGGKVLGKVLGGTSKISPSLEVGAQKLEQGTRTIRVKPSVYGAGQEKAINETLTKYKVKGSAQQQYEALQPTMDKIESKITDVIKSNPDVSVTRNDVLESFRKSLASSVRSGELTDKQAVSETQKYLDDLTKASGGTGKFTDINLEKLRALKKLVNEDYKGVYAITSNPMSAKALTPRQKVIEAAWDSLDGAVKNASPEMKTLLKDESNLYKSAPSLSSARSNPPTLRFMGTSIPAGVTQKGKDVLTDVLRRGGKITSGVSDVATSIQDQSRNPLIKTLLGQTGARLPQVSGDINNQPNNEYTNQNTNNVQDTTSIPQQPQTNYVTGYSPEELYKGYLAAKQAGDSSSATQIKTMYDDETAYQKTQGGTEKPIPAAIKQRMDLSTAGLRARQDAEDILKQDPAIVVKGVITGGLASRKFDSALSRAVEGLLRARSGAAVPDSEVRKYKKDYGPAIGDTQEVALYKLAQLKLDLEDALKNNGNVGADYTSISQ